MAKLTSRKSKNETTYLDPHKYVNPFLKKCNDFGDTGLAYQYYLAEQYREIFDGQEKPSNQPTPLIKLKIAYALQFKGYKESGGPIPEKIIQNCKASADFDSNKLTDTMKYAVERDIDLLVRSKQDNDDVDSNGEVNSNGNGKQKKQGSGTRILQLLLINNEAKLTDQQIKDKLAEEGLTFNSSVGAYRSMINNQNKRLPSDILASLYDNSDPINQWNDAGEVIVSKRNKKK